LHINHSSEAKGSRSPLQKHYAYGSVSQGFE
jgi:hypothetical protein